MLTKQELRQLPDKDLKEELTRVSHSLSKIKMDLEGGYAKESSKAKDLRLSIARIKTFQREREIQDTNAAKGKKSTETASSTSPRTTKTKTAPAPKAAKTSKNTSNSSAT